MYGGDELYTMRQAAAFLGVAEGVVSRMVASEQLRAWTAPNNKTLLICKRDLLPSSIPGDPPAPRQLSLLATSARAARPEPPHSYLHLQCAACRAPTCRRPSLP